MAFSVLWKLRTAEYTNGTFFYYTLLTDPRFEFVSTVFGGLPKRTLQDNRAAEELLTKGHFWLAEVQSVTLSGSERIRQIAKVLTWWTLAIETAIAMCFICDSQRANRLGHCLLLLFCATTYSVATVKGFGWILVVFGVAQCKSRSKLIAAYAIAFVLIQLYTSPYQEMVDSTLSYPSNVRAK